MTMGAFNNHCDRLPTCTLMYCNCGGTTVTDHQIYKLQILLGISKPLPLKLGSYVAMHFIENMQSIQSCIYIK